MPTQRLGDELRHDGSHGLCKYLKHTHKEEYASFGAGSFSRTPRQIWN